MTGVTRCEKYKRARKGTPPSHSGDSMFHWPIAAVRGSRPDQPQPRFRRVSCQDDHWQKVSTPQLLPARSSKTHRPVQGSFLQSFARLPWAWTTPFSPMTGTAGYKPSNQERQTIFYAFAPKPDAPQHKQPVFFSNFSFWAHTTRFSPTEKTLTHNNYTCRTSLGKLVFFFPCFLSHTHSLFFPQTRRTRSARLERAKSKTLSRSQKRKTQPTCAQSTNNKDLPSHHDLKTWPLHHSAACVRFCPFSHQVSS